MHDNKTLNVICEEVKIKKRCLVLAHQNPDGDTLGSMLALGAILSHLGHVVDHVVSDPVPEVFKFLPFANLVKQPKDKSLQNNYDLAFSLDCGSVKRLGNAQDTWLNAKATINIDHHVSNERFAKINWIEAKATSTGQLIYWLTKALKTKVTKDVATLLYVTLLTDTGCFSNSNTNADALSWGAELIAQGAEHESVYRKVFLEKPFRSMKIFGVGLNNINLLKDGNLIWTFVDKNTMDKVLATSEDTEDIADHMMRTKDVKIGVFFREDNGEVKVSLRSNVNDLDVSKIAMSMGGGGHKRAAGINIKSPFLSVKDMVLEKVISELDKHKDGK